MKLEQALSESAHGIAFSEGWNIGTNDLAAGKMDAEAAATNRHGADRESFIEGYLAGQDNALYERSKLRESNQCPDCGEPLFRNSETDGHWMCGACDEAKKERRVESKPFTRDDIAWITGSGRYAQ